jgi:hypothetical protein
LSEQCHSNENPFARTAPSLLRHTLRIASPSRGEVTGLPPTSSLIIIGITITIAGNSRQKFRQQ